ncbi:MAG TPA: hypothetical protein VKF80_09510 [Candidatus Eisenbacteria bacterium]|nr:hypothetical protein [Candidatus Eisenbacteria bacterium]
MESLVRLSLAMANRHGLTAGRARAFAPWPPKLTRGLLGALLGGRRRDDTLRR